MSEAVTNGKWIGDVLARHGGFVWVLPRQGQSRQLRAEGPLTFRETDLAPAQSQERRAGE